MPADELVQFKHINDSTSRLGPKSTLAAVKDKVDLECKFRYRRESRLPGACFQYRKRGHYKCDCPSEEKSKFTLIVAYGVDSTSQWILISGIFRHYVKTASQLHDAVECDGECVIPNEGGRGEVVTK